MGIEPSPAPRARHAMLLGAVILLSAGVLRLVTEAFAVPSSSMEPTLMPGDHLVVTRYLFRDPERGDVVVFEDESGATFVKRIIGLPGDSIQIEHGRVLLNGEPLDEASYVSPSHSDDVTVHVVPRDHLFLLGDNRDLSADSRAFGFVSRAAIVGRAALIYWSAEAAAESGSVRWGRLFRVIH